MLEAGPGRRLSCWGRPYRGGPGATIFETAGRWPCWRRPRETTCKLADLESTRILVDMEATGMLVDSDTIRLETAPRATGMLMDTEKIRLEAAPGATGIHLIQTTQFTTLLSLHLLLS